MPFLARARILMLGLVLAPAAGGTAMASTITGDPSADGWGFVGNSLALGTYVRSNTNYPSKNFDFDVYSTTFTLETGSALVDGTTWQAGDLIIGVGATVDATVALTPAVRVIMKYGNANATFSPSSTTTPPGDGGGSSALAGSGGLSITTSHSWEGSRYTPANQGTLISFGGTPGDNFNQVGFPGTTFDNFAKQIYQLDASSNLLTSFETYLNVSQLQRAGAPGLLPAPGDSFVLSLQNNDSEYTDAFGRYAAVTAVPEPSSLALVLLGGVALAAKLRRRGPRATD